MAADQIVVLGTGGTIAGAGAPGQHVGYRAGQLGVEALVAALPGMAGRVHAEQVAQLDSKDMDLSTWRTLADRCRHWLADPTVAGLVVTHGTDTLEETAWFLHRMLDAARPVVLTCAMRPATALVPDGPQNLADALAVARSPSARGVLAVCAGAVHAAADVRKVHPYRLDPFSSGDAGPVAYVEEGQVRSVRPWPDAVGPGVRLPDDPGAWPRVEIVHSHAGADGRLVDLLAADGVDAIVVAATGNATLHHALEAALQRAEARGVRIVLATRCTEGRIVGTPHARWPSHPLSPTKARIDLLLECMG